MAKVGDTIRIKVPRWVAESKEIPEEFTGVIQEEREKAWKINVKERREVVWIPKSQVESITVNAKKAIQKQEKEGKEEKGKKESREVNLRKKSKQVLEAETMTRLQLERELRYIRELIDEDPEKAYRTATQLHNQLQEYASKVSEILRKLGEKLGEKPLTPAKETDASKKDSS